MKKGFTLAELLGVIAILGIIALIAVPIVNNSINESDEKLYETQLNQMIKGAKSYYADHLDELPENGKSVTITLEVLQGKVERTDGEETKAYLPLEADNPKTGEPLNPKSQIKVTNDNGTFSYEVLEETLE